jgi:hypothetical protein
VLRIKDLGEFPVGPRLASSKSRGMVSQSLMEIKGIRQGRRRGKDNETCYGLQ